MARTALRPYLLTKQPEGDYRVTVRTTRLNSQGYPLVSSAMLDGSFPTATSARAHLRQHFRAEANRDRHQVARRHRPTDNRKGNDAPVF